MKSAVGLLLVSLSAAASMGGVEWYAVDPMGERPCLPDRPPEGGRKGAAVGMVAARGEYEPCSFVLCADRDLGRVQLEIGDLKRDQGEEVVFPKENLDLKTVKVWYQNGNAWISYFADPKLKLCPELLLNDEDLVKVDTEKGWNYARLTEKDGSVSYRWINAPRPFVDKFACMRPNFQDAAKHRGATLRKGEYKQFFLTAHVTKDQPAGLYRGEVKIKAKGEQWRIPISLRVLDFELPSPKCYTDIGKDYCTWFCEYVGLDFVLALNGGDRDLAERQMVQILKDFVRHGETSPCYREHMDHPEWGLEAGMCFTNHLLAGRMVLTDTAPARYDARRKRETLTRLYGPAPKYLSWGDEYGLDTVRSIRGMVEIYQSYGFLFPMNSKYSYDSAGYFCDLWWPPHNPDHETAGETFKFNRLGGEGYFGWYASQHVGVENPAFIRRQYGFGPYRAGLSCSYNYAHHLDGWNDIGTELYKPMMFVYGTGGGCVDTLAWEGFREGLDDIRYATLLQQLALPRVKAKEVRTRYAAKKALQLLADADGDNMDLTTLRLEMIRHIEALRKLK